MEEVWRVKRCGVEEGLKKVWGWSCGGVEEEWGVEGRRCGVEEGEGGVGDGRLGNAQGLTHFSQS